MKPLEDYLRPTQKELFSKLCAMYRDRAVICKNKYISFFKLIKLVH